MNIWNKKIQELVLSEEKGNLDLAYELLEDKQQLISWSFIDKPLCEEFNLPCIYNSMEIDIWVDIKEDIFDDIWEDIKYIEEAYEQYMESQDSRINNERR